MKVEMLKNIEFYKDAEGIEDLQADTKYVKATINTHKEIKAIKVEKIDEDENLDD